MYGYKNEIAYNESAGIMQATHDGYPWVTGWRGGGFVFVFVFVTCAQYMF